MRVVLEIAGNTEVDQTEFQALKAKEAARKQKANEASKRYAAKRRATEKQAEESVENLKRRNSELHQEVGEKERKVELFKKALAQRENNGYINEDILFEVLMKIMD